MVDSGNGAYLFFFRIDLPNDTESTNLVKNVIDNLAQLHADSQLAIDQTMYKAARIIRLAATMNRKGDHTPTRVALGTHHRSAGQT